MGYELPHQAKEESARKDSNLRPPDPKSGALPGLRYSLTMVVAALATGTTHASPRKRDEASSESKHDDGSSRTSDNPHTRTVCQWTITSFLSVTGV